MMVSNYTYTVFFYPILHILYQLKIYIESPYTKTRII